ncbi:MAG TPA: hypothetical protein VE953_11480 [Terriglobales bacterium]|nr:hypothetical protein [Terriglobales bacterium]
MKARSPLSVVLALLVAAVQLGSAYVVLGAPDLAAARDFLTGTGPSTMAGSVAAAQLVLWIALGVAFLAALVAGLTRTVGAVQSASRNAIWSIVVVATGAVILAAGIDHRSGSGSVMLSGGSVTEARAQLAR